MDIILSSISLQGLLWSVMAIGVYLTFSYFGYRRYDSRGSYPLGAAVCATGIVNGLNPFTCNFSCNDSCMGAGLISGLLHTKLKFLLS